MAQASRRSNFQLTANVSINNMKKDEAENIVERELFLDKKNCSVMPKSTKEFSKCFCIYYQSNNYVETGQFSDMLVGHGPVLIEKSTGRVFETGSALSEEHYVEAFEVCGDPNSELSNKIVITGWLEGANKVLATKCLKESLGIGLAAAKKYTDSVLAGSSETIECKNSTTALEIKNNLAKHGFIAKQLWSNQC